MKLALSLAAIAVVSAATANTAQAYSFTPKGVSFVAKGTLQLTALGTTVSCKTTLTGATTAAGKGSISAATFGGTNPVCGLITAANLPWPMVAKSLTKAAINGVAISGGSRGSCGPSNIKIGVTSGGKFKFNQVSLTGGCMATGALQTSPVITITNP